MVTDCLQGKHQSKGLSNHSQLCKPKNTFNNVLDENTWTILKISTKGEKSTTKLEKPSLCSCAQLQVDSKGTILANYHIPKLALRAMGRSFCSLLINLHQTVYMVVWQTVRCENSCYLIFFFCLIHLSFNHHWPVTEFYYWNFLSCTL